MASPLRCFWYAQFTPSTRSARNDSVVVRSRGRSPARTVVHFDQYLANKGRPGGAAAGDFARRRRHLDDARGVAVGTEFRFGAGRTGPGDQIVSCRFGASRGESRTRGGSRGRTNQRSAAQSDQRPQALGGAACEGECRPSGTGRRRICRGPAGTRSVSSGRSQSAPYAPAAMDVPTSSAPPFAPNSRTDIHPTAPPASARATFEDGIGSSTEAASTLTTGRHQP